MKEKTAIKQLAGLNPVMTVKRGNKWYEVILVTKVVRKQPHRIVGFDVRQNGVAE